MQHKISRDGIRDVSEALTNYKLAFYLAYSDIRQRYRRSSLGPFWITISMGVTIGCIGLIFGNIFKAPMKEFLPFLASGLIIWSFINSVLIEATSIFPESSAIIRQLPIPLYTHILRMLSRNVIIFAHNFLVLPITFLLVGKEISWSCLLAIPGFIILIFNLNWMVVVLGILCARFRDLTQIIASIMQMFFYFTPVIWMPSLLPERASVMILDPNLFYHLMSIVREPLLGLKFSPLSWIVTISVAIAGNFLALCFFNNYRKRIAYWL